MLFYLYSHVHARHDKSQINPEFLSRNFIMIKRYDGRENNSIRPLVIQYDVLGYSDASVFFELGQTKILVAVTLKHGVPPFLKGSRTGWLTAEYAMLPCATHERTMRESNQNQRNARSIEISRLIGRSLRTIVDLSVIGEQTITIDCDVLQADGGTRTAAITAASLALELAAKRWIAEGFIPASFFKEPIAAISAGIINKIPCLDISYQEDSIADADFNFVITKSGKLIEVQGTCEKTPATWEEFEILKNLCVDGIKELFAQSEKFPFPDDFREKLDRPSRNAQHNIQHKEARTAFFSLGNRLTK